MRRKKMYAGMLAIAVITFALAGCGDGKGSTQSTEAQDTEKVAGSTGTEDGIGDREGSELSEATESGAETEEARNTEPTETEETTYEQIHADDEVITYGGVVQVGDSAYELYTYVEDAADIYATAVNKAARELDGTATVYDLVIPLGSGIVFPDNLRSKINSTDQKQAVKKIRSKMDEGVSFVDFYDALMEHRSEYLYFRTDHHWTALGAYYAYEEFCKAKGITAEPLDGYETKVFDGFLGSFYKDTNENAKLAANPDVVTAYLPKMKAICHVEDSRGVKYDSQVIYDETKAAASLKYSAFIAGDNPYTEIVNSELADGSSCIVVKESFGNAFVPFLVDHYQTIYVVDYRYWTGSVGSLAAEKGVNDVIFINNLSMIRNKSLVGKLYRVI